MQRAGVVLTQKLQKVANQFLGPFGRLLPIEATYQLRDNSELYLALADIIFALIGFTYSPLAFACVAPHVSVCPYERALRWWRACELVNRR